MADRKLTEEEQKNPLLAKARAARVRLAVAEIDSAFCDVAFHAAEIEKILSNNVLDVVARMLTARAGLEQSVIWLGQTIEKARAL